MTAAIYADDGVFVAATVTRDVDGYLPRLIVDRCPGDIECTACQNLAVIVDKLMADIERHGTATGDAPRIAVGHLRLVGRLSVVAPDREVDGGSVDFITQGLSMFGVVPVDEGVYFFCCNARATEN